MDLDALLRTDEESKFYLELVEKLRANTRGSLVTMIVFTGAAGAAQEGLVRSSLKLLKKNIFKSRQIVLEISFLNQDTVKNINKWGPEELTDYLLTFDIHICPTHPHQGNIGKNRAWNVANIYRHVDR